MTVHRRWRRRPCEFCALLVVALVPLRQAVAASPPETSVAPPPPASADGVARNASWRNPRSRSRPRPVAQERQDADVPTRWYGWQTLIGDAAAVGLTATAGWVQGDASTPLSLLAGLAYWVPSPIVHEVHHQELKGALSIGLRLGIPVLGAVAGAALGNECWLRRCPDAGRGAWAGAVTAMLIDSAFLAHEPVPHAGRGDGARGSGRGMELTPVLLVERRGGWLGVSASL